MELYVQPITKLFVHPSIPIFLIHFSESNAHMIPGFFFYRLISTKKNVNDNFQNNRLNITNLTGELCKIGKNKINFKVENILN